MGNPGNDGMLWCRGGAPEASELQWFSTCVDYLFLENRVPSREQKLCTGEVWAAGWRAR